MLHSVTHNLQSKCNGVMVGCVAVGVIDALLSWPPLNMVFPSQRQHCEHQRDAAGHAASAEGAQRNQAAAHRGGFG